MSFSLSISLQAYCSQPGGDQRRLVGKARRWRGEEPEEPDRPLQQAVAGHQPLGDPASVPPLLEVGQAESGPGLNVVRLRAAALGAAR